MYADNFTTEKEGKGEIPKRTNNCTHTAENLCAGDFVQAGDMRQALWKVVDAVDVAGKVACTAEYQRVCSLP